MTEHVWKAAFHSLSQQLSHWGLRAKHVGLGAALSLPFTVVWADTAAPHWINYAQQFGAQLEQHVHTQDSEVAQRLAIWAVEHNQAKLGPLQAKFWFERDGSLRELQIDTLHDAQADADLQSLLQGLQARYTPPPDMPQPLRLSLQWSYE